MVRGLSGKAIAPGAGESEVVRADLELVSGEGEVDVPVLRVTETGSRTLVAVERTCLLIHVERS